MRYKIKDIGDEGLGIRVAVTDAWFKAECPELDMRPAQGGITLVGRLELAGDDYLLRGDLRGGLMAQCSRCLEPATFALDVPVTLTFTERDAPGAEEDDDEEEEEVVHVLDGVIDLGSEIRDELLLSLPMSLLCREDCAGICPTCGVNRNLTPCDCAKGPAVGAKLGALAKVKL